MPEYPHVTAILKNAGLIDAQWFTDEARDRGSALHLATQYLDEGDLDWATVDKSVLPRLRQYQIFRDEVKFEILSIEETVVNETLRYQGRLDRRVRMAGREAIIDIKSPYESPWHGVQLALYADCFAPDKWPKRLARYTLHLSDDRYKLVEHKDPQDYFVAKAALTIAAWKESNGY